MNSSLLILHNFWSIQIIGFLALIVGVFAWNVKTRVKILNLQSVSSALFVIHYFLLGAYTGALMSGLIILRNFVFSEKKKKKWANHSFWIYFFMLLATTVLVLFWQGLPSILPVAGVILGTFALSRDKPKDMRFFMLLTAFAWIPYTIIVHSYSGLISQIISTAGIIVGMFRLDRKK